MNFLDKIALKHRAEKCNDELICFISSRPLTIHEMAYGWNSDVGSVPIHFEYSTADIRKQWMRHQKEEMKEAILSVSSMYGLPLTKEECLEYVERTFPKK